MALIGWKWKKPLPLPATTGDETDLNFKVAVSFVTDKMQADFSDIRFTDSDGITLLSQYRESYVSSTSAVWWIKVPSKPAGGKTVYMYYNNSSASLSSDGDATFGFFDDFTGSDGDPPDTDKWTISDNDYVKIDSNTLSIDLTFLHLTQYAYGKTAFSEGYGIRFSAKKEQGGLGSMDAGWGENNAARYTYKEAASITDKWRYISSLTDAPEIGDLTYHIIEIRMITALLKRYYFDNTEDHDSNSTSETDDQNALFYMTGANPTDPFFINWVMVFKLPAGGDEIADPVLGTEEGAGVGSVKGRINIIPIEEITSTDEDIKSILASEIRTRLFGDIAIEEYNPVLTGIVNGFEDKSAYHIEAQVNGNNAITAKTDATMVFIQNTGKQYLSSALDGIDFDKALKITLGGATLSILDKHEPFLLKDNNGGIDASGLSVETVETDGSTIASGLGLAVEFLAI